MYDSFSMTKLYQFDNCHRSFVTRVEFLKSYFDAETESKSSEHLISISVDNQIFLHTIPMRGKKFRDRLFSPILFTGFHPHPESNGILGSHLIFAVTLVFVYLIALLIGL